MDIKIKTDAESEVLSSSDIAGFLKYEDGDEDELALIDEMIKAVRVHFEKRTGLSFVKKTYQVHFKYDDKPYILPVSPVISVEKVETVDYEGEKIELTLNTDYWKRGLYEIEIITTSMATIPSPFLTFDAKYDLLVEFKAGYGDDETETLPGDLLDALKKQVKQWYDNRDDFYEDKILGSIDRVLRLYKKTFP
jgi:uncharacterized phiE125 gp8 family phage protein